MRWRGRCENPSMTVASGLHMSTHAWVCILQHSAVHAAQRWPWSHQEEQAHNANLRTGAEENSRRREQAIAAEGGPGKARGKCAHTHEKSWGEPLYRISRPQGCSGYDSHGGEKPGTVLSRRMGWDENTGLYNTMMHGYCAHISCV